MTPPRTLSAEGLAFIKAREGLRLKSAKRPDGRSVIGYSHLADDAAPDAVTEAEAEALLTADLEPIETAVNDTVHAPLTQNQFDALASFAFSIGAAAFVESGVVEALNAGRPLEAAALFDRYCVARLGGRAMIVDALVRRRADERALFLRAGDAPPAASSALLAPEPLGEGEYEALFGRPVSLDVELDALELTETDGLEERAAPKPGRRNPPPDLVERLRRIAPDALARQPGAVGDAASGLRLDGAEEGGPGAEATPAGSVWRGPVLVDLRRARPEWLEGLRENWAWALGGVGLGCTGAGLYWLYAAGDADAPSGVVWRMLAVAGVMALAVSAYRIVRRRLEDGPPAP